MRTRLLFLSIILALVLTTVMPVAALAAKPGLEEFAADGSISGITPGKVIEAGVTGKWVVVERELTGNLLSGDISGSFTMNYHAMVESLDTQAGDFHGTLAMDDGSYVLKVDGEIQPLEFVGWYLPPGTPGYPNGVPLYRLAIGGEWNFTNGTWGRGGFEAWAIFVPTPDGHVAFIVDSSFTMKGQWKP